MGSNLADVRCGLNSVGELLSQGWKIAKQDYIKSIGRGGNSIVLGDGSTYSADMTSGMLVGDRALLLSMYVKSEKAEGYIYNICAGGFDAWVTPVENRNFKRRFGWTGKYQSPVSELIIGACLPRRRGQYLLNLSKSFNVTIHIFYILLKYFFFIIPCL